MAFKTLFQPPPLSLATHYEPQATSYEKRKWPSFVRVSKVTTAPALNVRV